ncbi:retinoblastoma-like protein 2 [Cololabis saira]|uniref:retinoblastoma-like protein 2 n=1 Tax=Cololabis saira TaxID=129043 RepID=UPI002AD4892D|nr:retinoblastoma-like protein 2 [Cololabis saira]
MATTPHTDVGEPKCGPSERLIHLFRKCPNDPTEKTEERLSHMLDVFLQHQIRENKDARGLAEKCCRLTRERYYQILEPLLRREDKIKGVSGVSMTLEEDLFQRHLVTCCLEISVRSAQMPSSFSTLLQIFQLPAHSFPKMIGQVVGGLGLLHPVAKMLLQVETDILESFAWARNSKLWEDVKAKGPVPTWEQVRPLTQQEDPPPRTESDQPAEHGEMNDLLQNSSSPSVQRGSSSAMSKAERYNSFKVFFSRFYVLMEMRLKERCSELGISEDLKHNIWTCLEHALVQHTNLLENRDLDQLLLCAIYDTAKITQRKLIFDDVVNCFKSEPNPSKSISQTELTLDDVITCYTSQPDPNKANCDDKLIPGSVGKTLPTEINDNGDHTYGILTPNTPSGDGERGALIHFYHDYSTRMQQFTKRFAPNSGGETPPLSPYPQPQKGPPRSYPLPGHKNIKVSLLDRKSTPTYDSPIIYAFKSSPPEFLRTINNKMKSVASRSSPRRGLKFDKEELADDGPPSKKPRPVLQRRLWNVDNDRKRAKNQSQAQPSPPEDPDTEL